MMSSKGVDIKSFLIYSVFMFVVEGYIQLNASSDTSRCFGSQLNMSCVVGNQTTAIYIFEPDGLYATICTAPLGGMNTVCNSKEPYKTAVFKSGTSTTIILTILSLNKSEHNGIWTCQHVNENSSVGVSVISPLTALVKFPVITTSPAYGGTVSNVTINGHVYCQNTELTSELLYADQIGVYKVLEPQPIWSDIDVGNNGCDDGETNKTYTTTVTRTMSALRGKTVTFKIRFNQTACNFIFTTTSSPVFFFPDPPDDKRTSIKGIGADSSLSLMEGENKTLQCEVNGGVPLAVIKWNCFGVTVTNTSVEGIARSNINFTATDSQNGKFCTCSATHPVAVIVETSVQIHVTYKPRNITLQPPSSVMQVIHEHQNLGPINCSADCNAVCNYTWSGPRDFYSIGPTLYINNIKRDQIGSFNCTASNNLGSQTSKNIKVDVYYLPDHVFFEPQNNTSYIINETGTLGPIKCSAECRPNCSFTWIGPDYFIPNHTVLKIDNIQKDEAGVYNCSARNIVGTAWWSISVEVYYSPKTVVLNPEKLSYTVNQSQNLGPIICSADCNPNCIYQWNGPKHLSKNENELYIENISKDKAGIYNCIAANILGNMSSKNVTVNVDYGPDFVSLDPPNSTYTVNENQTLGQIYCSADCKPNCSYVWNGPRITSSKQTLRIDNIRRNQSGMYNCTATNILGLSYSHNVIVKVKYAAYITSIVLTGNNFTVNENSEPQLTCNADGFPKPIIKLRHVRTETVLVSTTGDHLNYTFSYAKCEDTGQYRCEADNNLSTLSSITKVLYVLCSPRRIDKTKSKIPLASGSTIKISTIYLAYPKPDFYWYFKNKESYNKTMLENSEEKVQINNTYAIKNKAYRHESLLIINIHGEQDFGIYTIIATNAVGGSNDSFIISAEGKPNQPSSVQVNCTDQRSATVSWISEFDNGYTQSFYIQYKTGGEIKNSSHIADTGQHNKITKEIGNLKKSSIYKFKVVARNKLGDSHSSEVNCTSSTDKSHDILPAALAGGFGSAAFLIIMIIVVVFVLRRFKCMTYKGAKNTDMSGKSALTSSRQYYENDEDDMRINELYVSAGSNYVKPGSSSGAVGGPNDYTYSEVKKTRGQNYSPGIADVTYAVVQKKTDKNEDSSTTYAVVDKTKKTKEDGVKRKQKALKPTPQVYENIEGMEMKNVTGGNLKNPKTSRKKNEDGLIYVDLDLPEPEKNISGYVIHGEENRTNYVEVDFTKGAVQVLPVDENKDEI